MQAPAANVKWSFIFEFMTWMALYEKLVSFPDTQCVCYTKGLRMRPMKNNIPPFLPYKKGCIWARDQDDEKTKQT